MEILILQSNRIEIAHPSCVSRLFFLSIVLVLHVVSERLNEHPIRITRPVVFQGEGRLVVVLNLGYHFIDVREI